MAVSFKGVHFPKDVMLTCVRWYVPCPLSARHDKDLMEERGITVDHFTINRWVITYGRSCHV
jgi:transposase-like protein